MIKHSDELVANGFTNYAGKEITRPLRIIKNFLNKFGYDTEFLQQRGTVKRERVFTLIKMPHIEQYVNQRKNQQYQALANTHANESLLSKEMETASVHPIENEDLAEKLKKLVGIFTPPYDNFEFAT